MGACVAEQHRTCIICSVAGRNKYIFRARISERKFRQVLRLFAADVSALASAELCALNYRTVHRLHTLWRARIVDPALEGLRPFAGEIEIDESYFRVRGKRGRGAGGKTPVLDLHKRGAQVFISVVKNCSRKELLPVISGHVLGKSDVYTDGWRAYDGLVTGGFPHHRIHHEANEFARGKNHVNGIESFWSFTKARLAKLHGVRRDRLLLHLKEGEWRFNYRKENRYQLLLTQFR